MKKLQWKLPDFFFLLWNITLFSLMLSWPFGSLSIANFVLVLARVFRSILELYSELIWKLEVSSENGISINCSKLRKKSFQYFVLYRIFFRFLQWCMIFRIRGYSYFSVLPFLENWLAASVVEYIFSSCFLQLFKKCCPSQFSLEFFGIGNCNFSKNTLCHRCFLKKIAYLKAVVWQNWEWTKEPLVSFTENAGCNLTKTWNVSQISFCNISANFTIP